MQARLPAAIFGILVMASGCRGNVNANPDDPMPQPAVTAGRFNVALCPPLFIMLPRFGFYMGAGAPYDIVYAEENFYLYYGKTWYRAPSCKGPWTPAAYDILPPMVRKQTIESVRQYRDQEYRAYRRDQTHYRGRTFQPDR